MKIESVKNLFLQVFPVIQVIQDLKGPQDTANIIITLTHSEDIIAIQKKRDLKKDAVFY